MHFEANMLYIIGGAIVLTIVTMIMFGGLKSLQPKIMIFSTVCSIVFSLLACAISFFTMLAYGAAVITVLIFLGILFSKMFLGK